MKPSRKPGDPFPKSDHFNGELFFNGGGVRGGKSFGDLVRWKINGLKRPWPAWVENTAKPRVATHVAPGEIHATFVNHATHLLQFEKLNLLTDPVFSKRVSPFQWAGPARSRPPGVALTGLPRIDLLLVSHNHYDHLDEPALRELNERFRPRVVTPLGNASLLRSIGFERVDELDWWESAELEGGAGRVTLVPAQHWSARWLNDRNRALWGGFVVESGQEGSRTRAYFAGDTGYGPHFKEIARKFPRLELALLPIGCYEPRWFMKDMHMNPADAVQAALDLDCVQAIGTHYGTFALADDGIDEPIVDLAKALAAAKMPPARFVALETGATIVCTKDGARPA